MMEIYLLDDNFFEIAPVIDAYKSLIWTERFDKLGDFELVMAPDENLKRYMTEGRLLSITESNRMMVIEKIRETPGDGGEITVTYSGPSFERILDGRVARVPDGGSTKAWLNYGTHRSLIVGEYHADDVLPQLKFGTNKIYPASTIPCSLLRAPYDNQGWVGLGSAHDAASNLSPLGFRIVRKPGTRDVYYDNYTGNNRSHPNEYNVSDLDLTWPNPHLFETDKTVPVWRNLAKNPGFTNDEACHGWSGEKFRMDVDSTYALVDVPYSKSGKGLEITPSNSGTQSASAAFIVPTKKALSEPFDGAPYWGRTFTVTAKIELKAVQTGTLYAYARSIVFSGHISSGSSSPFAIVQAPNTVGVHSLTLTFTMPAQSNPNGYIAFDARLVNGSANPAQKVIWTDFCMVEHPSNPIGYFDGDYSPDPDLAPLWLGERGLCDSLLVGNGIQGVDAADMVGCVLVQSKQWGTGGVSARLIKNSAGAAQSITLRMKNGLAKRAILTQYQTQVLSGANAQFGVVTLKLAGVVKSVSSPKPNTATERTLSQSSNDGFDTIELRTGFTQLGGSLWFDGIIASPNLDWVPTPNEQVIFAEDLDSFVVSESFTSIANYRNSVYVTRGDYMIEMDDGYTKPGIMRRIIHVDASNLDDTPQLQRQMEALGLKALGEHRRTVLIDGTVPSYSRYVYDKDYFLGDIVMVRTRAGNRMIARVSEQIFISDAEGIRTFPTLREEQSIILGTWFSPEYNIIWNAATGEWADQP